MKKAELVLIPAPGSGHYVSAAEFAKLLLDRDDRLAVTILVICVPGLPDIQASAAATDTRIKSIVIPPAEPPHCSSKCPDKFFTDYIESHKPHVEHVIETEMLSDDSVQIVGMVVDTFCIPMIDVAHRFKLPSYLFFTMGAAFLGFMLYLPTRDDQLGAEFGPSDEESFISTYKNPVPRNALPSLALDKDGYAVLLYHGARFKETKGYIINTFSELESHAINSLKMAEPPIYPVGPLLDLNMVKEKSAMSGSKWDEIMAWLDDQPPSSVVFLCFGSEGCFDVPQLEQIAIALEGSGYRFLWSIRRPPPRGELELPTEYQNIQEVLPSGFLDRTKSRGMVCGWAPQVKVLAHQAIGGFVSHCGWNSILESLWYSVPIATWPLYAEQHIHAFQLVRELGLAVEVMLDYRRGSEEVVLSDVIETAINHLMDERNPVRSRVKEISEKSRKAVVDGGSSYASFGKLIEDFHGNNPKQIYT